MERRAYRLLELTERFGGEIVGDPSVAVTQVASLRGAGPDNISFYHRGGYQADLAATAAGAVVLGVDDRDVTSRPRILCQDPHQYFARVVRFLNPPERVEPGVHPSAVVSPSARVSPRASIGASCVIGARAVIEDEVTAGAGCVIGDDCHIGTGTHLHGNVTIYDRCRIGKRCVLLSGAVIGSDGFGFSREDGRWLKIPQIGAVRIGDDVEIGANTTIDRGALDDTVIEDGVKLDNQIQIGHNCRIGAHTAMAGCVGMAGSSTIGQHCMIGGAAMISGHISIGDRVIISGGTLVTKSIRDPGNYTGVYPIETNRRWSRNAARLRHLDELADRVAQLERSIASLENKK